MTDYIITLLSLWLMETTRELIDKIRTVKDEK